MTMREASSPEAQGLPILSESQRPGHVQYQGSQLGVPEKERLGVVQEEEEGFPALLALWLPTP